MTAPALKKPLIEFRAETHQYFVYGREVRAWSTIAKQMGVERRFPQPGEPGYWNTVNAKHRGKQIHQASCWLITGVDFDPAQLDNESIPYVHAFCKFWRRYSLPGAEAETPLYCADLDFCTTPDFHTPYAVYDIKATDRPARSWGVQTAAQALALGGKPERRIIWLRPKLKTRQPFEIVEPGDIRAFSELDFDVVREACAGIEGPAIQAWKRGE
jgi:hypothetical protein